MVGPLHAQVRQAVQRPPQLYLAGACLVGEYVHALALYDHEPTANLHGLHLHAAAGQQDGEIDIRVAQLLPVFRLRGEIGDQLLARGRCVPPGFLRGAGAELVRLDETQLVLARAELAAGKRVGGQFVGQPLPDDDGLATGVLRLRPALLLLQEHDEVLVTDT